MVRLREWTRELQHDREEILTEHLCNNFLGSVLYARFVPYQVMDDHPRCQRQIGEPAVAERRFHAEQAFGSGPGHAEFVQLPQGGLPQGPGPQRRGSSPDEAAPPRRTFAASLARRRRCPGIIPRAPQAETFPPHC